MNLSINQVLYIQVASYDEEEARQEYKSRIADITTDFLAIEIPIHSQTGRLKRLRQGDQLSVYFVSEGGVKNYFNSYVTGFSEDVYRLVRIKKPEPESITRVQRRNFLRVPADLDIAVKLNEQVQFVAVTDDVGGGGISFLCEGWVPMKVKDVIACWLLIHYRNGQIDHAYFKGEVVRLKTTEVGKQLAMVSFSEIIDAERQKIIRYCFERQFDLRK